MRPMRPARAESCLRPNRMDPAAVACSFQGVAYLEGRACEITRALPEETAIAMVYNGTSHAVLMATPADLPAFGVGFSLTEGIITEPGEIEEIDIVRHEGGIEIRMMLAGPRADALDRRRRFMAGPVGCGLCGIESLEEAIRPAPKVAGRDFLLTGSEINEAVGVLGAWQPLHRLTRATHVAGFYRPGDGIVMAAEDVGRHNALDKLIGMMLMQDHEAGSGAVVLSSRVSVEMVQKSAVAGFPVIIAASSPTAHGARSARAAGITLATLARGRSFEVLSHPFRIRNSTKQGNRCHVA